MPNNCLELTYKWYGGNKDIKKQPMSFTLVQHTLLNHELYEGIGNNLGYCPNLKTWHMTLHVRPMIVAFGNKW